MLFKKIILIVFIIVSCSQKKPLTGTYKYTGPVRGQTQNKKISEAISEAEKELKDLLEIPGQKGLYSEIIFKGEKTAVIKSFGMEFGVSYEIDGDYVKIKTDQTDLLFKITDSHTLTGEGFATGIYKKE